MTTDYDALLGGLADKKVVWLTSLDGGIEVPDDIQRQADEFWQKDHIEGVLEYATLPPLEFDASAATPLAEAADPDPIRELEAAWQAEYGDMSDPAVRAAIEADCAKLLSTRS